MAKQAPKSARRLAPGEVAEPVSTDQAAAPVEPAFREGRFAGENVSAEETAAIQERQRGRSKVMALGLLFLCVLFFLITIVKIGVWG